MTQGSSLSIDVAAPEKWSAALLLAYRSLPAAERVEKAAATVAAARRREIELAGLMTASRGESLVGALLAQPMPGKTALVWPPQLVDGESLTTAQNLLQHALSWLKHGGVRVAQGLIDPAVEKDAERLRRGGFSHAADLMFMACDTASVVENAMGEKKNPGLTYQLHRDADHRKLAELVQQTYEDSLDCPAIDKLRQIDDVLDGYRQTGVYNPNRWLRVQSDGQDVGCLLLADHPAHLQWELVYMGLVPQARGRGLGLRIVRHAQRLARRAGRKTLVLAVDAANDPAISVYTSAGFNEIVRRSVYLKAC